MIERLNRVESNRHGRIEKVESPLGLNLSTLPNPAKTECATGETIPTVRPVKQSSQSLRAILAPDPDALAWAMSVRRVFANARPLHGRSAVGEVGRDWWPVATPWREWLT